MSKKLKLVSWNVNGIRAVFKKDFEKSLETLSADIVCLQETKIQDHQITEDMKTVNGYETHWCSATVKKGYSGTAVLTKISPASVKFGLGIPEIDGEGRIVETEFDDFTLFNVYFPNGQMSEERLNYKLNFYDKFFEYVDALKNDGKSVIIAGDYNTAHNEIDLKNPKANEKNSGFLRIERDWLDRLIENGYVDTFRHFYPDTVKYSWWTYRFGARGKNVGWRIDYFFVTENMMKDGRVKAAFIDNDIFGSDHCPIGIEIETA